jgi:hypothetical protein
MLKYRYRYIFYSQTLTMKRLEMDERALLSVIVNTVRKMCKKLEVKRHLGSCH